MRTSKPVFALEADAPGAREAMRQSPAFKEVFHTHAAYVLRLLRRLGVRECDLDDVAQEVFLAVHRKLPGFEARSSLKTWVSGICLRKALDHRRRSAQHALRFGAEIEDRAAAGDDAETQLGRRQEAALFERALEQLPDQQRAVFVLYEVEELEMSEVAAAVGCPRFTAYTRLHAARKRMRAAFARARAQERSP